MTPSGSNVTVLHAARVWLQTQQNWIFNQVKYLPETVAAHVYCEEVANRDQFDWPNLHVAHSIAIDENAIRGPGVGDLEREGSQQLASLVHQLQPDVVHSHFGHEACNHMAVLGEFPSKHVVSFYGLDATSWPYRSEGRLELYQRLFAGVSAVFCEGPAMGEQIVRLGCAEEKIIVHHLGADLSRLPYRPRTWTPGTPLRVLIAASFRVKKGIPYAIRALGAIRDMVDLEVTIIGDARGQWDAREKERILAAIQECGLSDRVQMTGFQPYTTLMQEAYDHHIFLSPSITARNGDSEGGAPVTIIEMAATGMPIVSSFHCDIPEVVLDGETGWLAPEQDWNRLADHLRWLIDHPDEWRPFLDAGRQRIESEYDCRALGKDLAAHYERLINRRPPSPN